jgi:hypothetical protein
MQTLSANCGNGELSEREAWRRINPAITGRFSQSKLNKRENEKPKQNKRKEKNKVLLRYSLFRVGYGFVHFGAKDVGTVVQEQTPLLLQYTQINKSKTNKQYETNINNKQYKQEHKNNTKQLQINKYNQNPNQKNKIK